MIQFDKHIFHLGWFNHRPAKNTSPIHHLIQDGSVMKVSGTEEALGLRLRLQGVGTVPWRFTSGKTAGRFSWRYFRGCQNPGSQRVDILFICMKGTLFLKAQEMFTFSYKDAISDCGLRLHIGFSHPGGSCWRCKSMVHSSCHVVYTWQEKTCKTWKDAWDTTWFHLIRSVKVVLGNHFVPCFSLRQIQVLISSFAFRQIQGDSAAGCSEILWNAVKQPLRDMLILGPIVDLKTTQIK